MSLISKILTHCGFTVNDATNVTEVERALVAIAAAMVPGLPIPLIFVDPGADTYQTHQTPGRDCTRIRVIVGNSGVVVSLDDDVTASISLPPNTMDEILVAIPAATKISVKRYTAGIAWTNLIVEVR